MGRLRLCERRCGGQLGIRAWTRLGLLSDQFGIGRLYLVSIFIILDHHSPYPFLPLSLLNVYNNYTETATNL